MRIVNEKEKISYDNTKIFFDRRIKKFNPDNPYSLTMYQDNHPELVKLRNEKELEIILPLLKVNNKSKVLDIACGIGRWSDAIQGIDKYCGIDFCETFIELAIKRNKSENRFFYNSNSVNLEECLRKEGHDRFDRFLIIGSLMYLNDEDVIKTLSQVVNVSDKHAIICIREPIGIKERLTLKEQFSEELGDDYSAIYRTRDQLMELMGETLLNNGFNITMEKYLFDQTDLNNRKETAQYYFILER